MTDIGLMVRSANPVPDETQSLTDNELNAVLLLAQQRSGGMDAKELTKPVEQEPKRRSGWLVAAAAFAGIILIAGLIAVLSNRDAVEPADNQVPTTQPEPTTTLAPEATERAPSTTIAESTVTAEQLAMIDRYTNAINEADVEAIAALLGPDFGHTDNANPGWVSRTDLWAVQQAYWSAEGATVSYTECEPKGAVVTCLETWSGPVQNVVLLRDWTYQMDFDIQDELIVSMHGYALIWPDQGAEQELRLKVADWVASSDPDVGERLMRCGAGNAGAGFVMELADLCREYTVAWAEAGRP